MPENPPKRISPIEQLIDQACGHNPDAPKRRAPTENESRLAKEVAAEALSHIDTMYPAMWEGVPKTARTSLRNTIKSRTESALIAADSAKAPAEAHWIATNDRLPEDGQAVAFVVHAGYAPAYAGSVLGGKFVAGETGGFSVPGHIFWASFWMPLPDSPSKSR